MLTIGVVAYNNPEEILEFAEHLRTLPLPEHEVRIWDNSEDGRVLEALRNHPELGGCAGERRNLGFGEGHNRLFEESDAEHYLISNADVRYTERPGHAREIAAAAAGCDLIVAVGGDGTTGEVLSGIMDRASPRPRLAILPAGTGNDIARHVGAFPLERGDRFAEILLSGVA